jgi:hypothetical protein
MTRSTVLLSALLLGACTVGEVNLGGGGGPDGGGGDGDTTVNPRLMCADRGTIGIAHNHTALGANPAGPRSGLACGAPNGCHGATPGSSVYAFAGTLYKEAAGTTPNPGAVVRIFKENPTGVYTLVTSSVTDDAGNFYVIGDYTDFPYITDATACGSDALVSGIRPMVGIIANGSGNCNNGGACHGVPGTFPMYLLD